MTEREETSTSNESISRRTLAMMDRSMANFKQGIVGPAFQPEELESLLEEMERADQAEAKKSSSESEEES